MLMKFSSLFSVVFFYMKKGIKCCWGNLKAAPPVLLEAEGCVRLLEPGLYWCISALELLWQQLKPTAGSHVALSRVRQMKMGSFLYTNISITLRYKLSSTSLMLHWHFSFKKKTELPAMGWLCWLQVVLKCWILSAHLVNRYPPEAGRRFGDPSDADAVPQTSSLHCLGDRLFYLDVQCVFLFISPSPAMGDIHLAAVFSWGHIRTVYFGFYRNSASLSHCTFICSSDNSKDQQRCPWYRSDNLLSCGKEKNSLFFSFFFVHLYFMDFMNNQNHNIWQRIISPDVTRLFRMVT